MSSFLGRERKKLIAKSPFDIQLVMDILFNLIDVQDLSTPDLDDPSTPLSSPDLRLIIDRLQVRSVHITSKVHAYLRSHESDFSTLFSQCFDIALSSEQLSNQLFDLFYLISDHPVDNKIKSVIQEIVAKRKEVIQKKKLVELLGVVLELCEKLRLVKEDIQNAKVKEAAEALRELDVALKVYKNEASIAEEEERKLAVYELLEKEWMKCFEETRDAYEVYGECCPI